MPRHFPAPALALVDVAVVVAVVAASASPALAGVKHQENRLEVSTATYEQSSSKETWEVTPKGTAGVTGADYKETTKEETWNAYSAYPVLGVSAYDNGPTFGAKIYGFPGLVGGQSWYGVETSPGFEIGALVGANWRSEKQKYSYDPSSTKEERTEHNTQRELAVGPYLRVGVQNGGSKLELMPALLYRKTSNDNSSQYSTESEERQGFTFAFDTSLVVPLNKALSYVGALGLSYAKDTSGKKKDSSSGDAKLKEKSVTSASITFFGLRMML